MTIYKFSQLFIVLFLLGCTPSPTIDTRSDAAFQASMLEVFGSLSEREQHLFVRAITFYTLGGDYGSYDDFAVTTKRAGKRVQDINFTVNASRLDGLTGHEVLKLYEKELLVLRDEMANRSAL